MVHISRFGKFCDHEAFLRSPVRRVRLVRLVIIYYHFSPKWEEFQQTVYVSEDEPEGNTVTQVRAVDADSGEFGHVMYYITDDDIRKFTIDANTVSSS